MFPIKSNEGLDGRVLLYQTNKMSRYIPNLTQVLTIEIVQQRCSKLFIKRINYWSQKEDSLPVVFGTNNYVLMRNLYDEENEG